MSSTHSIFHSLRDLPKPLLIAELSGNHNHSLERTLKLMEAAKEAGASAIKIQTYTADSITLNSDKPEFVVQGGLWSGRRLHELYQEASLPYEFHGALFDKAKDLDIELFSSPFDFDAIDFLEGFNCPCYKIASPECIDLPLIRYAAETKKALIISTGMATLEEMQEAVATALDAGLPPSRLALLHCIAAYPAPPDQMCLGNIHVMQKIFPEIAIGLSDHSLTSDAALGSIALGARIIEKHFTLDRAEGGVDSAFSLNPDEFRDLVQRAMIMDQSIASVQFGPKTVEKTVLANRRSLYVTEDVKKGELFTKNNLKSRRPSLGAAPKHYFQALGKTAQVDVVAHTPFDLSMVEEKE